jgi:hypothetical protein
LAITVTEYANPQTGIWHYKNAWQNSHRGGNHMKQWTEQLKRLATPKWLALALLVLFAPYLLAQETTGGLQGTVKDPSGAVVTSAQVTVTAPTLVGSKESTTDSSGYYRFTNLPPGNYTITVTATGFDTLKREGLVLEVGHLPTMDLTLKSRRGQD